MVKAGRSVQGGVETGDSSSLAELGESDGAGVAQRAEAGVVAVCMYAGKGKRPDTGEMCQVQQQRWQVVGSAA